MVLVVLAASRECRTHTPRCYSNISVSSVRLVSDASVRESESSVTQSESHMTHASRKSQFRQPESQETFAKRVLSQCTIPSEFPEVLRAVSMCNVRQRRTGQAWAWTRCSVVKSLSLLFPVLVHPPQAWSQCLAEAQCSARLS